MAVKKVASRSTSLSAPVGGWNARDSLAEMKPTDAVYLTNFYPTVADVMLRKGYTAYATGLPGQVETVMDYSSGSTQKMFAASSTGIYDVTSGGAVGASLATVTNARFQYINVGTTADRYLLAVNGSDKMQIYTTTSGWGVEGTAPYAALAITGVNSNTWIHINLFKFRVWGIEKNTLKAWYLPTSAVGGVANSLDFSSIARNGGYLVAMENWTLDAGAGVDDHAAFITSNGEVIVYKGTDPSDATKWSLVGVWEIGAPVGRRCSLKWAGDCLLITQDGLMPMASALQSSRLDPRVALTDKIYNAVSLAASQYGSTFGWQLLYYARENMLILNVPVAVGQQQQFVMNTISKSWCNWTNIPANCWAIYNEEPYFGGNTIVGKAWNGYSDNNTDIVGDAKQAFSYFGAHGLLKRWTMVRPVFMSEGSPGTKANLNIDFDDTDVIGDITYTPTTYGLWDSSLWDSGIWAGGLTVTKYWQGVTGVGFCAALRLKMKSQKVETHWMSTDFVYETGAVI